MKIPRLISPRLILPLAIFCGVLLVGLSVGDLWQTVSHGIAPKPSQALAEAAEAKKPEEKKPAEKSADKHDDKPPETAAEKAQDKAQEKAQEKKAEESAAAAAEDEQFSPAEMDVLKQLAARRDELDKRARALDTREALMKVGEQRVDQKIKEMATLRLQMQQMVDQISGAQAAQLENLVKIYETMKPAEAAKIFESLDMPVLLGVIQRMKPARSAPVLAAMAPDKAKEVTIALTKQDQLPKGK